MSVPRVIAIDGAAGSGKSTLAKGLALAEGLPYVNTGAMYRALTLAALQSGIDPDDGRALADLMRTLSFSLGNGPPRQLLVDGSPPSAALTGAAVEEAVSRVARHGQVRELMRQEQRRLGADGAVMEGRDISSVVFPEAPVQIYLVADPEVRARRRAAERAGSLSPRALAPRALAARDDRDANVNPFEPQPGAVVIDTSDRGVEETLEAAVQIVRDRMPPKDMRQNGGQDTGEGE